MIASTVAEVVINIELERRGARMLKSANCVLHDCIQDWKVHCVHDCDGTLHIEHRGSGGHDFLPCDEQQTYCEGGVKTSKTKARCAWHASS